MKVLKEDEVNRKTNGSSFKGYIKATYNDLVRVLGEPTYSEPSGDNKVQKEWVVEFYNKVFTIYDWKTFDVDETMNYLDVFNVGGHTSAEKFISSLEKKIKK